MDEAKTAQDWCQTEEHFNRMLRALRYGLSDARSERERADARAKRNAEQINAIKIKAREMGWSEDAK